MHLNQEQIKRYSRHILLPGIGLAGQQKLIGAKVLVVGVGGLGCPVALYLAAAGVGRIGLVDFDKVDSSNLQRQILFTSVDVGMLKVEAAAERLKSLNPGVRIDTYPVALKSGNVLSILEPYDLIIDATDNFPTRYLTNDAAFFQGKPNIYGSLFQFEGQVSVFKTPEGPCYRCLYPEPPPPEAVPSCAEGGVIGAMAGIIGSLQALEAVKLITGIGIPAVGKLLVYHALRMDFRELNLSKDPSCPVCGTNPTVKQLIDYERFCGIKAGDNRDQGLSPGRDEITPRKLKTMMEENRDFVLLDVREPNESEIARIKGSILFPLSQLPNRLGELKDFKGKDIVVYCKSGVRSRKAIRFLRGSGYERLVNLTGGILEWSNQVDPSVPKY